MATRAITKFTLFVLGALAAAAVAAPAQPGQPDHRIHNRASITATELASATCVASAPATTTSAYYVDYAAVAAPGNTTGSYDVDKSFRAAHHVGSVTVSPSSGVPGRQADQSTPPRITHSVFARVFALVIVIVIVLIVAVGIEIPQGLSLSTGSKDYASFKCQYTCNGTPGCVSFFGRFVQVNSTRERFECMSFDVL